MILAHEFSNSQKSMYKSVSGAVGINERVELRILLLIFWDVSMRTVSLESPPSLDVCLVGGCSMCSSLHNVAFAVTTGSLKEISLNLLLSTKEKRKEGRGEHM